MLSKSEKIVMILNSK